MGYINKKMAKQKAEIEGGATLWARQTIESEIFYNKPDKWFKIWFYLVNRVSHKNTKKYKRGETFIFYDWICDDVKATKDQVKKCMGWLNGCGMVSTRRSTRGVWLKVCKYEHFQTLDNYYYNIKAPDKALEKHQRSTREAPRYNKNDKNDKNEKNISTKVDKAKPTTYGNPLITKFLTYLKEKAEVIDTPVKYQRTDSWVLIRKMKSLAKEKKGGEPTDDEVWNGLKFLVDTAAADKFHSQRVGNIKYLYNNIGAITKSKSTNQRRVFVSPQI